MLFSFIRSSFVSNTEFKSNSNDSGMLSQALPGGFVLQYCHHSLISHIGSPASPACGRGIEQQGQGPSAPGYKRKSWGMVLASLWKQFFSLCFILVDFYLMMALHHVAVKSNEVTGFFPPRSDHLPQPFTAF